MSPSSQESKLSQLREALAQANSEFFLTLSERRKICIKIQEFKTGGELYAHYDPEREKIVLNSLKPSLESVTIKELLAFSLVMEDQATALAPGSYPNWSGRIHLSTASTDIYEMINPLILKCSHPDLFRKLQLAPAFTFLNDL